MIDIQNLMIQKVSNGYIVREDNRRGDFICNELAVFNNADGLCEWIKNNFTLSPSTQPFPDVTLGQWSPDKNGVGYTGEAK